MFHTKRFRSEAKDLIEILERAGARPASVAACSTRSRRGQRRRSRRPALGRNSKHGELRLQLLALALRAHSFLLAENQRLELVLAFLADVLEDVHEENSVKRIAVFNLNSNRGYFANTRGDASLHATPLVARRSRADSRELFNRATFSCACSRGAVDRSRARRPGTLPLPLATGPSARADRHHCARPRGVEHLAVHARRHRERAR